MFADELECMALGHSAAWTEFKQFTEPQYCRGKSDISLWNVRVLESVMCKYIC